MYYDTKNNNLLDACPLNGYLPDGSWVQGLNIADFETQKSCGILPVKSDNPSQPNDTYEDISQRQIVVEDDGVIITRVYLPNPVVSPTIPQTISARQVRLWLIDNNINLTAVEEAIDTIENEKLKEKTLVEWKFAPYIERNHPLIQTIGGMLGLNDEQINQGFLAASEL